MLLKRIWIGALVEVPVVLDPHQTWPEVHPQRQNCPSDCCFHVQQNHIVVESLINVHHAIKENITKGTLAHVSKS